MLEKWLQITCDVCGCTDNSTTPNLTQEQFLREIGWTRNGNRHRCGGCKDKYSWAEATLFKPSKKLRKRILEPATPAESARIKASWYLGIAKRNK